ncbi:MAG: hypothetical protein LWW94_08815 [Candidatus Desulfofervidaceae bacterium]|nr:hypothetical protein [Candidatus Desulfofervidaceae bacterium]
MENYPWYKIVGPDEPFLQGDFIDSCPVIIPPSQLETGQLNVDVVEYDVVIMSQSCDLAHGKLDLVLVCPIWPLSEFEKRSDFFKSKKGKEALRRGNVPGYHLLNRCGIEGFETDCLVVDFRNVYGVPFNFILELATKRGKRRRLLPPYREHLSQAFARFFMRVGLPVDIPPFK